MINLGNKNNYSEQFVTVPLICYFILEKDNLIEIFYFVVFLLTMFV